MSASLSKMGSNGRASNTQYRIYILLYALAIVAALAGITSPAAPAAPAAITTTLYWFTWTAGNFNANFDWRVLISSIILEFIIIETVIFPLGLALLMGAVTSKT